jgi:hypothetical protein
MADKSKEAELGVEKTKAEFGLSDLKIKAPRVKLLDFVNGHPGMKSGRVELLGAFIHHMENVVKITVASEEEFHKLLEDFKNLSV